MNNTDNTSLPSAPDINDPRIVEAFVDGIVKPLMKQNHSPSGVVSLMKDGQIIFSKGYGYQDIEKRIKVDPNTTLFRPGSISKLFTWVSVMQQVERGNLDLDVDVNRYLKTFQIDDTWPGQPITLRHILSHTAGLEDGAVGYLILDDVSRIVPLAESLASHIPTRVNPPGKHTAYSNWATAVAGLIVANVTEMPFNDYVQKNIFDVLEMKSATFVEPLPQTLAPHIANSYGWKDGQYVLQNFEIISNFGPAGSSSVSSTDMANFARAILNNGQFINSMGQSVQLLNPATTKQMLSTLNTHDPRVGGMSYGFINYPFKGIDIIGHGGATMVFKSHFGLSLDHNLMLFYSFSGPGATSIFHALKGEFYDYFFPSQQLDTSTKTSNNDFAERAASFVGSYQPWRSSFTKMEALMAALKEVKVVAMPNNTLLIGEKRYVEVDNNLFREIDGDLRIAFQADENGEISEFLDETLPVTQMSKVPFYRSLLFFILIILVSSLIFIEVILHRIYQAKSIGNLFVTEKRAMNTSLVIAITLFAFVICAVVGVVTARNLAYEIPWLIKFALTLPVVALLATSYLSFLLIKLWRDKVNKVKYPVRLTLITATSLIMLVFYNYWNLLGFNYYN
ncbi:serine hydrolase domain-containing protein [Shewanella aestuarii]|uniref:Beta-lactamase family protein n=1 Tax=Shewanella aestuarii TaxID=1028752 RepID=A0A6G9QKD0_9GAMM|nr:serine hydrolase domain-containing protein [Shewanella aestuarii]QIR14986.1 beta-lactamase family protein [Shewanella aestuarii]